MTLFAPIDTALQRTPIDPAKLQEVLEYHMDLGQSVRMAKDGSIRYMKLNSSNGLPIRINNYFHRRTFTAEGVQFRRGGKIHVINGYIYPLDGVMSPPQGDVVDVIAANGALTSFNSLLSSNGLTGLLRSKEVTVFAPRDSAFAKLDSQVVDFLLSHPNNTRECLLYHILEVQPIRYRLGLMHGLSLATLSKGEPKVMLFEDFATGDMKVNTARIVDEDITATEGVVHIIDEVLIPASVLMHMENKGIRPSSG